MSRITTVLCQYYEIDAVMDKIVYRYFKRDGITISKVNKYQYNIQLEDGIIFIKAETFESDFNSYMNWFMGRNLGNVILTKEMLYLLKDKQFMSRVRDGYIVVDLEEL